VSVYTIREARIEDAAPFIEFLKMLADEPDNMIAFDSSAEVTFTIEQEQETIRKHLEAENDNWFVAEADGQIIANSNLSAGRRGFRNTVAMGITVAKDWRGQGVGTALLHHLIGWCHGQPTIHRLELEVFTINTRAIQLYRRVGFVEEGIRRESYLKGGVYLDVMMMGIIFRRE
jgi:RimJ/RimL family protein N-acetyltransferase